MTPDQFLLEYWKEYRAYMASKEHLIEIATTLYLAFVSALILRDDAFWVDRNRR
jgi:propanediol dehydratase small subunit